MLDVILLDAKSLVPVAARTHVQPLLAKEVLEFGICMKVRLEVLFEETCEGGESLIMVRAGLEAEGPAATEIGWLRRSSSTGSKV